MKMILHKFIAGSEENNESSIFKDGLPLLGTFAFGYICLQRRESISTIWIRSP